MPNTKQEKKSNKKPAAEIIIADTVFPIELSKIEPSPFEPQARRRARFKPEDIETLGASIVNHKLRQPILVRPVPVLSRSKSEYQIVFGERRFLAVKSRNFKTINCFIENLTDAEVVELQYEENHRRQENDPLDDAFLFKYLFEKEKYSIESLADRFATTVKTVRRKLSLNDLIAEAVAELSAGDLPLRHAYYLASFPEAAQRQICEEQYAYKYGDKTDGAASFDEFKQTIEEYVLRRLSTAPFDPDDERLHMHGLKCGDCPQRSGFEPRLFAEIATEDSCLNKECFEFKTNVNLRLQRDAIAESMPNPDNLPVERMVEKVQLVTERKYVDETPFVSNAKPLTNQNLLDEPECEYSQVSLAVAGAKKGQKVYVCNNADCAIHHPKPAAPEIVLDEPELRQKEYQFETHVKELIREKVFAEAVKFFDDYKPFWTFDDLIQRLVYELWISAGGDIKKFIRAVLKDWKNIPKDVYTREEVEKFIASLDKGRQSQLLFLLTFKYEGFYRNSSFDGVKKLAADYTKLDYKMLDAETRLELAPDEFKETVRDYIGALAIGNTPEPPRFWFAEDENFDDVELTIDDE